MKPHLLATLAAALLCAGQLLADDTNNSHPVTLSEAQMDAVTAGVGANNVASQPWPALLDAGFTLNHNVSSDPGAAQADSLMGVAVPSAVPNSFCISFC